MDGRTDGWMDGHLLSISQALTRSESISDSLSIVQGEKKECIYERNMIG